VATRSDSAQALVASLNVVVEENKTLAAENTRLKQVLEQIAKMLARASAAGMALVDAGPAAPPSRGRAQRRGRPARRRRAPVTNPESLERRRAALARAREALAAKRAARRELVTPTP